MCGRFAITMPAEAMAEPFEAVPGNDLPGGPDFNICPTDMVAAVTSAGGLRRLRPMRWGFLPHWYKTPTDGPLLINARADTLAHKPAFAAAARQRRCLIPASGFYEWQTGPQGARLPWYISRSDGAPIAFAAIWQGWERDGHSLTTCAIVTTGANARMAEIHTRMPVILEPADWPLWLGEAGHGAALLMRPADEGVVQLHRVGTAVNSTRADGPELIEPI
ncbi:SOS response-associated peptidase [Rhodovulum sulfidophilum]|uniref:SOS response-associated peptidase n=1 Tax=Rhodovulum sulfidophilum TaxID=35806 RepID=UPI001922DB10|nr:SOS response-associated peptidase [Rhodovulum sulfidophilum]MBL3597697.1 SOS response-associated peptidase [Rhodovulum sulfidophilum]